MPLSLESGALRLKPRLRVRLRGRNRLPELACTMSLATIALLFGIAFLAPANGDDRFAAEALDPQLIEMRSAATSDTSNPVREHVRIIPLNRTSADDEANG